MNGKSNGSLCFRELLPWLQAAIMQSREGASGSDKVHIK